MGEQATPSTEHAGRWLTRDRDHGRGHAEQAALTALLTGIRDRVLDAAAMQPGHRVLDIGAGTGLLTHAAATRTSPTGTVVAVDLSTTALARIAHTAERTHPVAGDACRLPLAAGCMDRVIARSVLIYLHDLPAAFREIRRVLKQTGVFSAFEPINAGRRHDAILDGLPAHDLSAVEQLRHHSSATATPMLAFSTAAAIAAATQAGLTAQATEDSVDDHLTTHDQVDAYLTRAPHPGAAHPLDLITEHLGAPAATRYAAAWHHALEHAPASTGITFTTPVVYLTARPRTARSHP